MGIERAAGTRDVDPARPPDANARVEAVACIAIWSRLSLVPTISPKSQSRHAKRCEPNARIRGIAIREWMRTETTFETARP